jgi:hypothetical protein
MQNIRTKIRQLTDSVRYGASQFIGIERDSVCREESEHE